MRIIQITDLHIGLENEDTHGVDVRENFIQIFEAAHSYKPDFLVFTGDVCYSNGQRDIYEWFHCKIKDAASNIPTFFLSGNHDDTKMLAEVLGLENMLHDNELYFFQHLGEKPCLFLDSSKGVISDNQLSWIKEKLKQIDRELFIFVHHPFIPMNVPYMDGKHSLKNSDDVIKILSGFPHKIFAFSGHYHVDKLVEFENLSMYVTPSCFFQIHPFEIPFTIDHYKIGFRVIDIEDDRLLTTVRYLDGNRL